MRIPRRQLEKARIEIIPMIDIIFFLLVFFMVSTLSMTINRGLPVNLPTAASSQQDLRESFNVTVMQEGTLFLPRYPESPRRQGITGTTLLLFEVLANGRVGEVQIERSAGHSDLDEAAAEAIKKWRFEPARRGNQPVAVWLRMPVRFVLK
jgi:TonB family protein